MKPSDFLGVLLIVLAGAAVAGIVFVKWISTQIGLSFWDVLSEARLLLSAPLAVLLLMVIQASGAPFPLRVSNSWPVIAGLFWMGIHDLITLKAEQTAFGSFGGNSAAFWQHAELPWFTADWFMVAVLAAIVVGGYAVSAYVSSDT